MSGIYIHIPFCKSKCHYCDFYSVTGTGGMSSFAGTVAGEIRLRADYLPDKQIDTVYFGGGTPTLPDPGMIRSVLEEIRMVFRLLPDAEITIEANPDDLDPERLQAYRKMGFNRISIGIQSFNDNHLTMMNRRHDSDQAAGAVRMATEAGFGSISIDLIYGYAGLTREEWIDDLKKAVSLPVDHLSAYHLTIEPGTRFGRMKELGVLSEIPDEESLVQYELLRELTAEGGFSHYEISNFAREGRISRHNSKYWDGSPYLGLGPSAHSYNLHSRHWNPPSLSGYVRSVTAGIEPDGEIITPVMHRNEFIMIRLRTASGISGSHFIREFGQAEWEVLLRSARKYVESGVLLLDGDSLRFDRSAWFRSDAVMADLFKER